MRNKIVVLLFAVLMLAGQLSADGGTAPPPTCPPETKLCDIDVPK